MQRYLQGNYKLNFKVALKNIGDKTTKPARNEPELNLFNPKDNIDSFFMPDFFSFVSNFC